MLDGYLEVNQIALLLALPLAVWNLSSPPESILQAKGLLYLEEAKLWFVLIYVPIVFSSSPAQSKHFFFP